MTPKLGLISLDQALPSRIRLCQGVEIFNL